MQPRSGDWEFPGVTPSRQKRSREMTAALLRAGAEMLRTRSLSELSIEALCGQVGATVGAFYSRFDSKEAYFNALIALTARDGDRMLSLFPQDDTLKDAEIAELCSLLLGGIIGWMRNHQGVLRAALQHDDTRPDRWSTFKGLARNTTAAATPAMLRAMGRSRSAAAKKTVAFGFQVVLGTLVNAILNDPGPLSLHDDEMKARLSGCLSQLLQAEVKATVSTASPRKSPKRRP
jgi:AcrR family transcriptional regulator